MDFDEIKNKFPKAFESWRAYNKGADFNGVSEIDYNVAFRFFDAMGLVVTSEYNFIEGVRKHYCLVRRDDIADGFPILCAMDDHRKEAFDDAFKICFREYEKDLKK